MAGYVRQSSFVDGDTVTAALFNDEYNQLVNAFHNSTGHAHDGTAASGPVIGIIGDAGETSPNNKVLIDTTNNYIEFYVEVSSNPVQQLYIADGAIIPVTDNDVDLGTSSLEFKDLYLDGTAHIDTLDVDANAGIIGNATVGGTLGVTGNTTLTANLTVNGNTTLGNAASDTVTITADVASDIIPSADSTHALGDSSNYWSHGYIDAITTTGNVAVGGNLTVTGTTTFNGGTITMGDAATDNVVFGADVDSNIIPDDDDTYDLGSSSQEWRNLYIDGTANIDSLVADTADINGGTIDSATIATSDITVGSGKTLDVSSGTFTLADNQISGDKVEGGTIAATTVTTLTSTTGNITSVNATTVDTTNIELTNLKAKDGTAAGSIANSTGVVTLGSSVLTTTDINGGTIDGTIIGGSSAAAITGTAITGTSFVIGNADINEAELETIDGVTAGTVAASKAIVVDSNKDFTGARNITLTGELDAGSLDVSGDVDVDGTLETDALSINGTTVTSTAAELNILDGVTSTAAELNILDGVTSTAAELNILDGVTSTAAELNILDGVTASATDINLIDGITNGTVIASKAIITDSNKDITGGRNITISGELDAATLDISGDADIDGTLEADAITIGGVTLAETISDTVGAMVSSNTETNITVTYDDSDNTLDFVIGTLNQDTTGLAATATALATARTIHGVSFDGTANIDLTEVVQDTVGAMVSSNTESGITVAYQDGDGTLDFTVGTLNQDTTGTAALATQVTVSANDSTNESVYLTFVDGATGSQGIETDSALSYNPSTNTLTVANISVSGTQTIVDSVTMNANNAVIFEGSTADAHETTLTTIDATGDRTISLPNVSGTLPVLAAVSTTQITSTPEELNILDGVTSTTAELNLVDGSTAGSVVNSKAVVYGSSGEVAATSATVAGDLTVDTNTLAVVASSNRVGVNQASPDVSLDLGANTDAVHVPVGTTGQRPTGAAGYFRYNTSLSQFEGYTDAWGAIGGGGTNTFTHDVFTANGSTTAFALSQTTESENNLIVFVDGVFQEQSAYSIATSSGTTTLTMSAAPANGRKLVVYSVAAGVSGSNLNIDTMTGDGSDTTLTLSIAPVNENNTQVFFDGVYQNKSTYSISGTTLTFSTAPPTGVAVEVMTFTQTDINVPVDGTITSAKLSGDLTTPGTLTSTGVLTANAGVVVDNITIDGTQIDLSSGDLTLDVAGKILLSADDAGTIQLFDGSLHYGSISEDNSNLIIQSIVENEDILFRGDDAGSVITALTLDMSNAGTATFNNNIIFNGSANLTSNTSDGSDNAQIIIAGGGSTASADTRGASIHIAGNESGNGGLLQLRGGSGSVGGIRLYSGGSERLRVTDSGLTFNGDTAAANALDDYEEGTWTPAVISGASDLTLTSYAAQQGHYTKVGRLVHVIMTLGFVVNDNGTGPLTITGLPYTAKNDSGSRITGHVDIYNYNSPTSIIQIGVEGVANSTNLNLLGSRDDSTWYNIQTSELVDGGTYYIKFTGSYIT